MVTAHGDILNVASVSSNKLQALTFLPLHVTLCLHIRPRELQEINMCMFYVVLCLQSGTKSPGRLTWHLLCTDDSFPTEQSFPLSHCALQQQFGPPELSFRHPCKPYVVRIITH